MAKAWRSAAIARGRRAKRYAALIVDSPIRRGRWIGPTGGGRRTPPRRRRGGRRRTRCNGSCTSGGEGERSVYDVAVRSAIGYWCGGPSGAGGL
jgi:hypothetical protein